MRLKLLIVPFAIVVSLVLAIGYIKPDIDVMQGKLAILATKEDQSRNMTTFLSNIESLTSDLEKRSQSEDFIMSYLPRSMDEERVVDIFNFLASQSGVYMVTANFVEVESVAEDDLATEVANVPLVTDGLAAPDAVTAPVFRKVRPKAFTAEVIVNGSYENIKNFFDRVAHMNRYHKTLRFSLTLSTDDDQKLVSTASPETEGDAKTKGALVGTFHARFDYLPLQRVGSALSVPVFSRSSLDLTKLDTTLKWVTATVPVMEKPNSGRPNPFQ